MQHVAQTNLQLYRLLLRQGRSDAELGLVRAAYELSVKLYSGYFSADLRPFVCHTVGVAGVIANLGQPAEIVAAALLHNVYGNGDFGDGAYNLASTGRRRVVNRAVGVAVEDIVHRFHLRRVQLDTDDVYRARIEGLEQQQREVLLLDLADIVEKHVDASVLFHGDGSWISEPVRRHHAFLVDLARRIGEPLLATMLEERYADVSETAQLPAALRAPTHRRHRDLIVPTSCRRRLYPRLATLARWLVHPERWLPTFQRYGRRIVSVILRPSGAPSIEC
jgi:hypothetical protein